MKIPEVTPHGALLKCPAGCDEGTVTVLVGPANNDPWPSEREEQRDCEECRGTGYTLCSSIGCEEIATTLDPSNNLICGECESQLNAEVGVMDATEFVEKGKGATIDDLHDALMRIPESPAFSTAHRQLHKLLGNKPADADWRELTNLSLRPGAPLTAADLDRIARAEV